MTSLGSHIRRLSAKYNCPMPAIDVAHQHLITARAIHLKKKNEGEDVVGSLDWSGIVAGTRAGAGLDGFDRNKVRSFLPIGGAGLYLGTGCDRG